MKTKTLKEIQETEIHFIIALPRSGSTLLASMLGNHPQVFSAIEEPFAHVLYDKYHKIDVWTRGTISDFCADFFLLAKHIVPGQLPSAFNLLKNLLKHQANLDYDTAIRVAYLSLFPNQSKRGIDCIVDKELVLHPYLNKIAFQFKESKFVVLTRNPWDNICRWRDLIKTRSGKEVDVDVLATKWMYRYRLIRRQLKTIDNSRYIFVKYEDLIRTPETTLKVICYFIGKSFSPEMLNYSDNISGILSESDEGFKRMNSGLLKAPDIAEIGKWKKELTSCEAQLIRKICGRKALKLGYEIPPELLQRKERSCLFMKGTKLRLILKKKIVFGIWAKLPFQAKRFWRMFKKTLSTKLNER